MLIRLFSWHFSFINAVHALQKRPCTVQLLGTHENQNLTYSSSLRDFAVLISLVRGWMLASVSIFLSRLNGRNEHDYRPTAKASHSGMYTKRHVHKNATGIYASCYCHVITQTVYCIVYCIVHCVVVCQLLQTSSWSYTTYIHIYNCAFSKLFSITIVWLSFLCIC